jgi:molybdopterin molybdotransferase
MADLKSIAAPASASSVCGCDIPAPQPLTPISEALAAILDNVRPVSGTTILPVPQAQGRITTAPVASKMPLPLFDNSAMDGYGIHADDMARTGPLRLRLTDRIAAGRGQIATLAAGTTVQILTGAPVPAGVTAIVPHEQTRRAGDDIIVDAPIAPGDNIRRTGEDMVAGVPLLTAGTRLDPRHIALLLAAGIFEISVRSKVRVGLLSTGDELVSFGETLGEHHIIDTNRPLLSSLLGAASVELLDFGIVTDSREAVSERIQQAAAKTDLLITTGGICGSDADHIAPAICAAGGVCRQVKVALRPGKPIGIGRLRSTHIMCLPGNPLSAMVTAILFVRPLVRALAGGQQDQADGLAAIAGNIFRHKPGRTEFALVTVMGIDGEGRRHLAPLPRGSHRLFSLVKADGFAMLPQDSGDVLPGESLIFHPFVSGFAL